MALYAESVDNLPEALEMTNQIDTPRLIKDLLRLHGTSYAQIARELGVSRTAVSLVASGRSTSVRVQRAIADATGLTVSQIWPQNAGLDFESGASSASRSNLSTGQRQTFQARRTRW